MHRRNRLMGLATLALLVLASAAHAERVQSTRVITYQNPGTGQNKNGYTYTPYTTNGNSTLGVYHGVAPRVYASPDVSTPGPVQIKPVYNIIYYGSGRSFGTVSDGATTRPPNQLRPGRN